MQCLTDTCGAIIPFLSYLYSLALSGNITDNIIYSDLSNANMPGISTILIDITITTQQPDLVIVNRIYLSWLYYLKLIYPTLTIGNQIDMPIMLILNLKALMLTIMH